jgi:NADH dehydrogenase [ubiquinone] 1 alpha subcomplex assembly factor 7
VRGKHGRRIHGPIRSAIYSFGSASTAGRRAEGARVARDKAAEIEIAFSRLIGEGSTGMGELFKALAIADPKLGPLPGFEP